MIAVTEEIRNFAREHATQRMEFEFDRFGLDQTRRHSMIAMGTIGQLAFKQFLELNQVDFEFQLQAGKFDDFDFVINGKIVEIKTSGYGKGSGWKDLNAIYNSSQLKQAVSKKYFCSVQVFVNGYHRSDKTFNLDNCTTATIAGWIKIKDISAYKSVQLPFSSAHLIPLSELNEIQTLLKL